MSKKLQAESLQAEASVKDKIKNALNAYTPLLRENFKSTFVTLQGGKDLSTNDFTNDLKAKLTSIESGAQVNKLEKILLNGTNISIGADKSANITLSGSDNNFVINNHTVKSASITGATFDFDDENKSANVTISGGNNFVINNHTVKSATIEGADVTFTSDTAKISISSGLENFTVNGAEVTAISVVGAASVSTQSDTAIVSITGGAGSKMTLNGAEITSASITGANVSIDGGNACITIKSAESKNVTINGAESNIISISGAAQVSQGGGVTNLIIADRTPKLGANFSLSADNISLPAYTNATVSAVRLGDGVITAKGDRVASVETLTADSFKIVGKKEGATNLGFWLGETATYYPAAKNLNVTVTENPMPVGFDFEDEEDLFANAGYATVTSITGAENIVQIDDGEGGKAITANSQGENVYATIGAEVGGADFTFQARLKRNAYDESNVFVNWSNYKYNTNTDEMYVRLTMFNNEDYKVARFVVFYNKQFDIALNDDDWHDLKLIYKAAQQKAECYYDEELVNTFEGVTIAKNALLLNMRGYLAEVQVFDKAV